MKIASKISSILGSIFNGFGLPKRTPNGSQMADKFVGLASKTGVPKHFADIASFSIVFGRPWTSSGGILGCSGPHSDENETETESNWKEKLLS